MTHDEFQRACRVLLKENQEGLAPDNTLIAVLCEAVRCSRLCEAVAREHIAIAFGNS